VKHFLLPLGAALLLAGCSGGSLSFSIDNPTDSPISLDIDGTSYAIAAHDAKDVSLKVGEHTMHGSTVGDLKFIVYTTGKGGLINPTLSDYVIANEIYVTDKSKLKNFGKLNNKIVLDGVTFVGPFTATHRLFIDKSWSFGVKESFPTEVTGHDSGNGGNIFSKIFAAKDFIAYYEKNADAPDYFAKNRPADAAPPAPRKVELPPELPQIGAPAYDGPSAGLRSVYARYLKAKDASEQEALHKEYFDAQMAYTSATATAGPNLPVAVNEHANDFVRTIGDVMGASALVEQ